MHFCTGRSPFGRPFLAAMFDAAEPLGAWMGTVPDELRAGLETRTAPDHGFPVFLLEATDGLTWASEAELSARLSSWSLETHDAEWVYGNLYFVAGPWFPRLPGTDAMGLLPHIHVEAGHLECFLGGGLEALHRRWLGDEERRLLDATR